jgi:hypothetical protein
MLNVYEKGDGIFALDGWHGRVVRQRDSVVLAYGGGEYRAFSVTEIMRDGAAMPRKRISGDRAKARLEHAWDCALKY